MGHTRQINTGPEEPVLLWGRHWGNAYRSTTVVGRSSEGSGAKPRLVMSEKLKTQRAWTTIQNKTTRDYEQTRIIHSGTVNDRTNYICRYVHSRARYGGSTNRSTRHITHRFTQHSFARSKSAPNLSVHTAPAMCLRELPTPFSTLNLWQVRWVLLGSRG